MKPITNEVQYIEISLSDVLRYFAKDFEGYVSHAATVDTAKDNVVFKLTFDPSKTTNEPKIQGEK